MLEFKLPDMTCGHCASTVTKTCRLVDPEAIVQVDLGIRTVTVQSLESHAEFVEALAEAGYPAA